jgi:hypothetical protein
MARPAIFSEPSKDSKKRGIGYDALEECVPDFAAREKDKIIKGDNNTWIVLGRDRTPSGGNDTTSASALDGYGGRGVHGAGAIDIVVGRMAPFPRAGYANAQDPSLVVDPIFNTKSGVDGLPPLWSVETDTQPLHPGVVMDAARIYISQTTDIDSAFKIGEGRSNLSPPPFTSPRSAIALKADEIRVIARQGVKIVSGPLSDEERINSQGGDIGATYGIDLMAANGDTGVEGETQEPLVKGLKLIAAINDLAEDISDVAGIMSEFIKIQTAFNIQTAAHIHPEIVLLGFPGVPAPNLMTAMPIFMSQFWLKIAPSLFNNKGNLALFNINYLNPAFEGYICSRYNSTN